MVQRLVDRSPGGVVVLFFLVFALATAAQGACGGGTPVPAQPDPELGATASGKTEFQRRQEAACDAFGPRLTQCAYEDAKRTMTPAELAKEEVEAKRPEHTKLIVDKCRKQQMSSRQLRVYEVCMREESECAPLINCLEYAKPTHAGETAPSRP